MAVKIRLQRHGRKRYAYYHIVVADSRAPRDGKFIERLGSYNPNTNPAVIEINVEKALDWINNGAQPTDTARAILKYKGVLYKKHLLRGVKKGSLTLEEANAKFDEFINSRAGQNDTKIISLKAEAEMKYKERISRENEVSDKKAAAIKAKEDAIMAEAAALKAAEEKAAAGESEESTEEVASTEETTESAE